MTPANWIVSNDELAKIVLPWAKANHPDKYEATLKVAGIPATFRRYMIRLIEIRYEEEGFAAIESIPVSILDESALSIDTIHKPTGRRVTVSGVLASVDSGVRFWELSLPSEDFALLMAAKTALDLEHTDAKQRDERTQNTRPK